MKKITKNILMLLALLLTFSFTDISAQMFQQKSTGFVAGIAADYISIVDDNIIWATAGTSQGISISIDGGNTWTLHPTELPAGFMMMSLSATSATTAFMCGTGTGVGVYKTDNAGASWTLQPVPFDGGSFPNTIYFFDPLNGVVMGDADEQGNFEIYTTPNGGVYWIRVDEEDLPTLQTFEWGLNNMFQVIGNTIWFVSSTGNSSAPRMYRSTDKGLTWNAYILPAPILAFTQPEYTFADQNRGLLFLSDFENNINYRYFTNDGGQTYEPLPATGLPMTYSSEYIEYIPGTTYALMHNWNTSYISKNNGLHWTTLGSGFSHRMLFKNISIGFVPGTTISPTEGGIFKWANTISLIGQNIGTSWTTDIDMQTADGIHYTLNGYSMPAGEFKFRQNHDWAPNSQDWGGTGFPAGTAVSGGGNVTATANTYDVTFNRASGAYVFSPSLGIENTDLQSLQLYPNPGNGMMHIGYSGTVTSFSITDMSGKQLYLAANTKSADISHLTTGIYLIHINTGDGLAVRKFIRK